MFIIILGPGFYDISRKTVIAKVKKPHLKKPTRAGFRYFVPRPLIELQREVCVGPGPCDYQVIY